jgi:hypothetical protein
VLVALVLEDRRVLEDLGDLPPGTTVRRDPGDDPELLAVLS